MAKLKPKKSTIHSTSKLAKEHAKKLVEPNPFLKLQEKHQKWYHPETMGKQRGKPRYDMAGKKEKKESKGKK